MGTVTVSTDPVFPVKHVVQLVSYKVPVNLLASINEEYLKIAGSSEYVLAMWGSANLRVMFTTPAPTGDLDTNLSSEVRSQLITQTLHYSDCLVVYGVEPTPILTRKL